MITVSDNIIYFELLLLEAARRKRSKTIEVSRPVIHLPGPYHERFVVCVCAQCDNDVHDDTGFCRRCGYHNGC